MVSKTWSRESVRLRVAFTLIGGENWTGGYNYLLNLLRVVQQETPGQIVPILLAGTDVPQAELAPFAAIGGSEILRTRLFDEDQRSRLLTRSLLMGRDHEAVALLKEQKVDVVFESAIFLGWRLGLPAIAWVPDLQHRYLPTLFSRMVWWKREMGFRIQSMSGRTVMVSSEDTRQAFQRFYPSAARKVRAVRFAVPPPQPMDNAEARSVADRYELPERYFFMPNQFWAHKNHRLVVRALKMLKESGMSVTVVATGKQLDPRNAAYVPSLVAEVQDAGLAAEFVMPGMIPYNDLMPLMQASIALLNPSLFEGWSTTVEEARAAGVPMILSDLAVHREQAGSQAAYFDRHSAESLARVLSDFVPMSPDERLALRDAARVPAIERVTRFANGFIELVLAAAGERLRPFPEDPKTKGG
jgi:glycosyltransferase involved in cell wall biosynthesis